MNYIITKNPEYFQKIGNYNFCQITDLENLPEIIAFDTETTGLIPRREDFFCVQIGTGKDNFIIEFYTKDDSFTFYDVIPYIKDKVLVLHNALFDLGFCYKYNFFPTKHNIRDTMLASKILHNGRSWVRHDFGSVMERELNVIYDKSDQKSIHRVKLSHPSTIEYSFNDVDRLLELHDVLYQQILDGGFKETYRIHCAWIRALAYMESCGISVSSKMWKDKMETDLKNQKLAEEEIKAYIREKLPKYAVQQIDLFEGESKDITVQLTSAKQMVKVFQDFGINTKNRDGKDSIEESIISKSHHEFVKMWLKFQNANHRVTTFGENILQSIENERLYTNFNPMVDTARLSTRKGHINFLNFPADQETRNCFKAGPKDVMIVCDFEGQENVVLADKSKDEVMIDSVVNGSCLHSAFARVLFPEIADLSDDEIKDHHSDKRKAAKSPRFAFAYGGNAFTIHVNENIPLKRAEEIEKSFKTLHKGVFAWGDKELDKAIRNGFIESACGWKLYLPNFDRFISLGEKIDAFSPDDWAKYKRGKAEYARYYEIKKANVDLPPEKRKQFVVKCQDDLDFYRSKKELVSDYFKLRSGYQRLVLNNPIQSTSAHQTKLSMLLLFEWILESDLQWVVKIVNAVHDEIVLECPFELREVVSDKLTECMKNGADQFLTDLKMGAEAHYNYTWYLAKDKNI